MIEIVGGDLEQPTFLAIDSNGDLTTVEEKNGQPEAFYRFVNADGSNSFLSKKRHQHLKSRSGCQNFHLQEEGSDTNQFALVPQCPNADEDDHIELNDGKLRTFRLVDAPLFYYFMMGFDKTQSRNEVTWLSNAYFDPELDTKDKIDEKEFEQLYAPFEVRLVRDVQGKIRIHPKGFLKNLCFSTESDAKEKISFRKLRSENDGDYRLYLFVKAILSENLHLLYNPPFSVKETQNSVIFILH